jgi:hypothetical protein
VPGTERHANANFRRALPDRGREHAVQPTAVRRSRERRSSVLGIALLSAAGPRVPFQRRPLVSDVILWQQDAWRCVLCFTGALAHLRLYDGAQLISEQPVTAGLDAWQQANAWKTAITQLLKRKGA